jgi:peptidoglycan/LPS O-acetylase OafA/YrhL
MRQPDVSRNVGLDVCRASAIVLVVGGHSVGYLEPLFPNLVDTMKCGAFVGVELFFVLSGFLIGQILMRYADGQSPGWLKTFYLRRMFRTLPSYGLFLLLNILFAFLAIRPAVPPDVWKYLIFVQNAMAPHPDFFPEAWSLAIEELFYILFPLCFLGMSRASGITRKTAILVTALTVIVGSLAIRGVVAFEADSWDVDIRKISALRLDSLMVGVLFGWLHQVQSRLLSEKALVHACLAIFLFCVVYVSMTPLKAMNESYFSKTLLLTLTSFGCAGLMVACLDLQLPWGLERVVTLIAKSSYSAYLVNLPVMILMNQFIVNDGAQAVGWFLFFHLATFSVALVLYWNVEVTCFRYRERYVPEARRADTPHVRMAT